MINQPTSDKLRSMRMSAMADAFENQIQNRDFDLLAFNERFGMLVDAEYHRRQSNKIQRAIRTAAFRFPNACIEDVEYYEDRKLDKGLITHLSSCNYIHEGHHIILEGYAGSGKTYISNALGNAACRNYLSVRYIRLPELLNDLVIAKGEGTYKKLIRTYQKIDLLILDEWLLKPLSTDQAMELFEIIEARSRKRSMIFCSQYDVRGWYDRLGTSDDGAVSEAIIDRIKHNAHKIIIRGNISMRERHGIHQPWKGGGNNE